MAKRVCLEPDCPTLTDTSRCPAHTRERDKARGTTSERGYGTRHATLRRLWQGRLDKGERVNCWRCGARIDPKLWDLGHRDDDPTRHAGPECRPCNRATAGRR